MIVASWYISGLCKKSGLDSPTGLWTLPGLPPPWVTPTNQTQKLLLTFNTTLKYANVLPSSSRKHTPDCNAATSNFAFERCIELIVKRRGKEVTSSIPSLNYKISSYRRPAIICFEICRHEILAWAENVGIGTLSIWPTQRFVSSTKPLLKQPSL